MAKLFWESHEASDPDRVTEYLLALTIDSLMLSGFKNFDVTDIIDVIVEPIKPDSE